MQVKFPDKTIVQEFFSVVIGRSARIVSEVFRTFPLYCSIVFLITLLDGVLPVVNLWVMKLVIDSVVAFLASPGEQGLFQAVILMVCLRFGVEAFGVALSQANAYYSTRLSQQVTFNIQQKIYWHCLTMDYAFVETPAEKDKLFRSQNQSARASNSLFVTVFQLTRKLITVLCAGVALCVLSPALCVLAFCISIPNIFLNIKLSSDYYQIMRRVSECELAGQIRAGRYRHSTDSQGHQLGNRRAVTWWPV